MRFESIRRNGDFARAYKRGESYVHPHIVAYVNKNRVGHIRIGITTSKKIGGAVQRNRARRVIRSALAQVLAGEQVGYDLVLVARGRTAKLKSGELAKSLYKILQKSKINVKAPEPAKGTPHEEASSDDIERI